MARKQRKLSATVTAKELNDLKANGKRQLFYIGDYLYLIISATGKKVFYYKDYLFNGKRVNRFAIGAFKYSKSDRGGDLTLAEARDKAYQITSTYRGGIDYQAEQRAAKLKAKYERANTLNDWFSRWIETKGENKESTQRDYRGRYDKWIKPKLGNQSIIDLSAAYGEIEALYMHIQDKCSPEMAKRCNVILGGIFRLAIKKRIITNDPTQTAKGEIKKPKEESHFPAIIKDNDIGELMHALASYQGIPSTAFAFRMIPYLMLRPTNVVGLRWDNIDFKQQLIFIEAEEMKTNTRHAIPYPKQVRVILGELKDFSGDGAYLFPNARGNHHIHRDSLSKGLRSMGFQGRHTPHGFRSMATTWLYNNQFYDYAIEKQLAHTVNNKVVRAYSRDDTLRYLKERRAMLQAWADHIDQLREQTRHNHAPPVIGFLKN